MMAMESRLRRSLAAGLLVAAWLAPGLASAQSSAQSSPQAAAQASSRDIATALARGGYVIVMRHANSPQMVAQVDLANPDAPPPERRLDERGRREATEMGAALRRLKVPIAAVVTSPAYRTVETGECLGFAPTTTAAELFDGGMNSNGITDGQVARLRQRVAEKPARGNLLLITHQPNFARTFPDWGSGVAQGEAAVFRPDGRGGSTLVGRIRIDEWPTLR